MKIYVVNKPTDNPDDHWKPWFAWHPVKVGNYWVWLEWIERWYQFMGYYTELDYRFKRGTEKKRIRK